jgi:hypothetical protein
MSKPRNGRPKRGRRPCYKGPGNTYCPIGSHGNGDRSRWHNGTSDIDYYTDEEFAFLKAIDKFKTVNRVSTITAGSFTNSGAVMISPGSTFTTASTFVQTGGTTTLASGGTLAAPLVDVAGGTLSGSGTVSGDLLNEGPQRTRGIEFCPPSLALRTRYYDCSTSAFRPSA